jgi:putative colanic acid biosynthesis acetyltransferase WcaF
MHSDRRQNATMGAAAHSDASAAVAAPDPMKQPAFSLRNRVSRLLWNVCYAVFFRLSPRPMFAWRAFLLRLFGAQLGPTCKFYPKSKIWAPWNLICEDLVAVADDADLYNPSPLHMGSHCIVSQGAYICGATHEYDNPAFPLVHFPMRIGRYAWVCARAAVNPGVNLGAGAILALGSVATRDLEPFGIYAGIPARKVKERLRNAVPLTDEELNLV